MATRVDDVDSTNLLAALGGTVNANDTVRVRKYAKAYVSGVLASDLAAFYLEKGFRGSFSAQDSGGLTLVVNQTNTGVFHDRSNASYVDLASSSGAGVINEIRYLAENSHPLVLGAMDCATLRVNKPGLVRAAAACDINAVLAADGRTVLAENGPAVVALTAGGKALVELNRDVTTANVEGGSTVFINSTTCTPTTINMRGGTLALGMCGNIATLQGDSGVIDQRGLTTEITIAATLLGPGIIILRNRSTVVPVVTDSSGDYGGGPTIVVQE